jgi:pilus assembly protein CpaF
MTSPFLTRIEAQRAARLTEQARAQEQADAALVPNDRDQASAESHAEVAVGPVAPRSKGGSDANYTLEPRSRFPTPLPAPVRRAAGAPAASSRAGRAPFSLPPVLRNLNPSRDQFRDLRERILEEVIRDIDPALDLANLVKMRQEIEGLVNQFLAEAQINLSDEDRLLLMLQVTNEIIGLGPLDPLLLDDSIDEIMVNGPSQVYIERAGKIELTDITFENDERIMRLIEQIISPIGRHIDESSPTVDARLLDGSRIHAIIPPLSLIGPILTIRKFAASPFSVDRLVELGTATPEMFDFLRACVEARLNIFISGGSGSGKTTTLNVISSFIPSNERIITIEDAAELRLRQAHVLTLESRPPNIEGQGAVSIRELVRNALRMRPDRIIVGEVRAGEALDMLQAMNTGHDGSMSTGHANSPRDMLSRLETMVLMAGVDLPLRAVREQIASAVDLIVHLARLRDGSRKIVSITEVQGMAGDIIALQDVFVFEQTGVVDDVIQGSLCPTGIRPQFTEKFAAMGITLAPDIFGSEENRPSKTIRRAGTSRRR